jgi:hypothetical protein
LKDDNVTELVVDGVAVANKLDKFNVLVVFQYNLKLLTSAVAKVPDNGTVTDFNVSKEPEALTVKPSKILPVAVVIVPPVLPPPPIVTEG